MQITKLKDAGKNGWYIGNFNTAVMKSTAVEVCYNKIKKGHTDPHYHTKCTEVISPLTIGWIEHSKVSNPIVDIPTFPIRVAEISG